MAIKTASRGVVPAFLAMDVMRDAAALEAQGRRVVHLEVGQPATGLPKLRCQDLFKKASHLIAEREVFSGMIQIHLPVRARPGARRPRQDPHFN